MVASALFSNQCNWLGLVWEKFELYLISTCFLELLTAECIRKINLYQFLYLINGYLFFTYLEKVFEEERNRNRKGNIRRVTTVASDRRKRTGK